ncbi:MAG TPA: radical SAM protein [Anaerolineales bacterium]|nr:radical SAM protein [Anaerolineales bacterium]
MAKNILIHTEYMNRLEETRTLTGKQKKQLEVRKDSLRNRVAEHPKNEKLTDEENNWLARSYPVLAVLAPVMSTSEDKIEFPGDPMCLYNALSYAVDQAVLTREQGLAEDNTYNDLCPQWGYRPSQAYRANIDDNGIREYSAPLLNTDQTIFDPRVWNKKIKQYFSDVVLEQVQPKVVLISAVSPAHRYALDIARAVRAKLPNCIIILGGRHTDETVHFDDGTQQLRHEPSGVITKINEGAVEENIVDFIVAGQGYYALDLLMKSISLAMDIDTKTVDVDSILTVMKEYAPLFGLLPGRSLIISLRPDAFHAFPLSGPLLKLSALPSPYKAFAIRARFPIFEIEDRVALTAHMMVTNACPYHCSFCSEGSLVTGSFLFFKESDGVQKALERVVEFIHYGAEAVFFDDSIFWGGNLGRIIHFCQSWTKVRKDAEQSTSEEIELFGYKVLRQRILDFTWGAQLTADFLASRRDEQALTALYSMHDARCTYIYIGIESMSEEVIKHVHKNVNKREPWDARVRRALGMARSSGIRVGSSVLFGLEGETQETIMETIDKVEELLAEDLLVIASPNILTYHPNTEITHLHQMEDKLDYISPNIDNRPPYVFFEEAFPAVVSKNLSEKDIWYIHEQTKQRWGTKRNSNPMPPVTLRDET